MHPDRRFDLLAIVPMAVVALAGGLFWSALPAQMAVHWGPSGSPDTFVGKPLAVVGIFAFGVGAIAVTRLAPGWLTNTPGGQNVSVLIIGVVFAWVQTAVLVWNLGYHFDVALAMVPLILVVLGAVAVSRFGRPWG